MKSNKEKYLQEQEKQALEANAKRKKMKPWNGKNEPDFEVEPPNDGKR